MSADPTEATMILFLLGLFAGIGIGSVATFLAFNRWILPPAIERAYRQGWIKPGPSAEAEANKRLRQRA